MTDASAYGPSALATPANALTVIRLLVSPILFVMIAHDKYSWSIFVLWCLLAGTDGVDGWIARRHGTTRSGAFLDPVEPQPQLFRGEVLQQDRTQVGVGVVG